MKTLTDRQREVLKYIRGFMVSNGYSPSRLEIAEHCIGSSNVNSATKHILALKYKGYICYKPGASRSITVLAPEIGFGALNSGVARDLKIEGLECAEDVIKRIDNGDDLARLLGKSKARLFFKWIESNEKKAGINYG